MKLLWTLIPLLAGIIALGYTVISNLLRVWVAHRVKMALLEQFQEDPERLEALGGLQRVLHDAVPEPRIKPWVDHAVLGMALAAIGTLSVLASWCCGGAGRMTGAYFGGVICIAVGFILTLLGLVARYLAKLPLDSGRK